MFACQLWVCIVFSPKPLCALVLYFEFISPLNGSANIAFEFDCDFKMSITFWTLDPVSHVKLGVL